MPKEGKEALNFQTKLHTTTLAFKETGKRKIRRKPSEQ